MTTAKPPVNDVERSRSVSAGDIIGDDGAAEAKAKPKVILGKIAALLERSGIDVDEVGRINRVNLWQGMSKDADGEVVVTDLAGLQLSPAWADGPEWPLIQPAKPVVVRHKPRRAVKHAGRVTVLLPDPQIGFWRLDTGEMVPMHDEAAMDVAIQVIAAVRPDCVINLGDLLDLAEHSSKFLVLPEFSFTTQAALDRANLFLAEQRAAAGPDAKEIILEGNHDDRLAQYIARNARAALRLRVANQPASWPVLSLPALLGLDDLGVEYVGAYPAGRYKVAAAHGRQTPLVALHGKRLDMGKQVRAEGQSTVQGHAHHLSVESRTYELDDEPREVQAWSLGCLARIDGAVPSTNGGSDARGRPVRRWESWQQALAVVTETEDAWQLDPILIHDGIAIYNGQVFRSEHSGLPVA